MKRNKNLEWFAFYQDLNSTELVFTNVMSSDLVEDILKGVKSKSNFRKIDSYDTLKEALRSYFMWRYWGKSEYEVIVSNWSGRDFEKKIDIWYQLEPNLDRITEYVIRELKLDF
ncbi:MAG: hypothetical protein J6T15_05310 [Bacilli bacterium]|nr:hypothetical protein [Bacilli bacterium]